MAQANRKYLPTSGVLHSRKMSEEHRKSYFPTPKSPFNYPFYTLKDGDDCLMKTLTVSGYTGSIGTSFALVAGFTSTTVENPSLGSNVVIRLCKYGLPMFAAGGMFVATICAFANIRKKDDPYNHFLGGLATGSVFGTAFKSHKLGWGLGITFACLAFIMKAGKMEGFFQVDPGNFRRENTLGGHERSYFVSRPNPEGNENI